MATSHPKLKAGLEWNGQGHARLEGGRGRSIDVQIPNGDGWIPGELQLGALQSFVLGRLLGRLPKPSERLVSYFSHAEAKPNGHLDLGQVVISPSIEVSDEVHVPEVQQLLMQIEQEMGGSVVLRPDISVDAVTDVE